MPRNLAIELSLFVHEQTYKKIYFLKRNASEYFLAWVCPLLKPSIFMDQEYIYLNGDEINCCYFMKQGECGFVLACNGNLKYIDITPGNYFGIIDILGSMLQNGNPDLHLSNNSDKLFRQFTVQTQKKTEVLTLSLDNLVMMDQEYPDAYNDLFHSAYMRLQRCHKIKLHAIKYVNDNPGLFKSKNMIMHGSVDPNQLE